MGEVVWMKKYRGIWCMVLAFLLLALSAGVFVSGNVIAGPVKKLDWGWSYDLPTADGGATYGSGEGSYDISTGFATMYAGDGEAQDSYLFSVFEAAPDFTGKVYCELSGEFYGFTDCAFDFVGIGEAYVYVKVIVKTSGGALVSEYLVDWVTSGGKYNPGEHEMSGSFEAYREWTAVPGTSYKVYAWVYGGAHSPIHAHCNGWVKWTELELWCQVPPGFGGCVLEGTEILLADGSTVSVEKVKKNDQIQSYETATMSPVVETVLVNEKSTVGVIEIINDGLLYVTPTDQPIYARNDSYTGWITNPCDLEVGWYILNPVEGEWIEITSIDYEVGKFKVYEIGATGVDNYVANGILLDRKPIKV